MIPVHTNANTLFDFLKAGTSSHKVCRFWLYSDVEVAHLYLILGLFAVPTRIICIVAPINALLNYILGMRSDISVKPP
jgi:hypothetical protein